MKIKCHSPSILRTDQPTTDPMNQVTQSKER